MIDQLFFSRNNQHPLEVSDGRFRSFTETTLRRILKENYNGKNDQLRDVLASDYIAYFGPEMEQSTLAALQNSFMLSLENIVNEFSKIVIGKELMIRNLFDQGTPEYEEFYPKGVAEYKSLDFSDAQVKMERWLAAVDSHQPDLGPSFVNWFRDLYRYYEDMLSQQMKYFRMNLTTEEEHGARSRITLEKTVLKIIRYLAWEVVKQPKRIIDFFDEGIVRLSGNRSRDKQGNIFAEVKDFNTDLPLGGVAMKVLKAQVDPVITDNFGRARSETLLIGNYNVEFTKQGFEPGLKRLHVRDNDDTIIKVALERA